MSAWRTCPPHAVGVLASAMLLFLGGCSDSGAAEGPGSGPEGAASLDALVEDFRAAFDDRDVEAARALFCRPEDSFDGRGMTELIEEHVAPGYPDEGGGQAVTGLELEVTTQTDSSAAVSITYELETAALGTTEAAAVQPDGTWLFCSLET